MQWAVLSNIASSRVDWSDSDRAGPGGGQVELPHRASDFGRAPSNIHLYIILGVVSSTVVPLVSLRRTVLTLS